MPLEEQLDLLFEVIEGGAETAGEIIQFPSDVGATALEGVTESVNLGNGVATEVSQLTVVEGGTTTTAGVGLLSIDVGVAGACIAPALGIVAGVGLYSLAPEFWTNVSNALVSAGETIGGKVRAFLNGDSKTVGFSDATIEIFKQAFIDSGVFISTYTSQTDAFDDVSSNLNTAWNYFPATGDSHLGTDYTDALYVKTTGATGYISAFTLHANNFTIVKSPNSTDTLFMYRILLTAHEAVAGSTLRDSYTFNNQKVYYLLGKLTSASNFDYALFNYIDESLFDTVVNYPAQVAWSIEYGTHAGGSNVQDGATIPTGDPISTTYPTWTPYTLPDGETQVYPVEIPVQNPDPLQETAQNPDALTNDNADLLQWLLDNFPTPAPLTETEPAPEPVPDPDPQPEPDPIPEPEPAETDPDPVDPNADPTPSPVPIVPSLPSTVPANALFTVYAPTQAQVDAFGGWLWDSSIIESIKRIWQDPLDGIIAFQKVYASPSTGGSDTIKVGVLDSGVTAPIVTGQFVTVDCGSLDVSLEHYNATDYSPFVSLHLYLPFIGITELDVNEFMGGKIKVVYHIDVYTGTCLAEVKAKRSPDMSDYTIIYSFSGNASQQLPLTSAEYSGAISSLVSAVGGGLAIASGGGLGLLAGASGMAHAVSHEMVHLAHSGSMSANAGIMGARKPFLIITRPKSYDANSYNSIYGYPSNKTVYLNNCSGFVRVKSIRLKTGATSTENNEIESLLKSGVII